MGDDFTIDKGFERPLAPWLLERLAEFEKRLPEVDRMAQDEFDDYIGRMPKTKMHVVPALIRLLELTDDPYKVRAALRAGWFLAEMIADQTRFLHAFRLAGFIGFDDEPKPDGAVIAFRGTVDGYVNRLSWTTDVNIARAFAMRNRLHHLNARGIDLSPDVYRVEVEPNNVLGLLTIEKEVLVDYENVTAHLYERLDPKTAYDPRSLVQRFRLDRPPLREDPQHPH